MVWYVLLRTSIPTHGMLGRADVDSSNHYLVRPLDRHVPPIPYRLRRAKLTFEDTHLKSLFFFFLKINRLSLFSKCLFFTFMYSVLHLRQCWWQLNLLLWLCCYICPLIFKESSKLFQTFISCTSSLLTIMVVYYLYQPCLSTYHWHTNCTNHTYRHTNLFNISYDFF